LLVHRKEIGVEWRGYAGQVEHLLECLDVWVAKGIQGKRVLDLELDALLLVLEHRGLFRGLLTELYLLPYRLLRGWY
jgi:hypothetical protein